MVTQGGKETLVTLGDRVRLALLGNLALLGLLARGVLLDTWDEKAEKGRKVPRGSQALMGPQGGQAQWGLEGPQGVLGLRVFEGSPARWVNQASLDLLDRWALLAPWGPLASRG